MGRRDNPCQGCTKRWVSETDRCHSTCKDYIEFAEDNDDLKKIIKSKKSEDHDVKSVLYHGVKHYAR